MLLRAFIQGLLEAGCDEAGRGPLAGSVFAAAVILPTEGVLNAAWEELNDSKQLTDAARYRLRPIIEAEAAAWAVAQVSVEEIDQINILQASLLAMHRALDALTLRPEHIIVDGNRWKPYGFPAIEAHTVVKGDGKYLSIAAASVLAKTYRDDYMKQLHQLYPVYGWEHNMGYPTQAHYQAIREHGITPYHRKTFKLYKP